MTDLARLVVALEAQTAKYQEGLDAATRKLNKFSRDQETLLAGVNKQFSSFTGKVKGALVGYLGVVSFKAIIDATSEAEKAFALLDNAVKASGGAAGFTTQQLSDLAGELQKFTTYDDEAIMGAEQLLLRFQSIRGVNFTNATKSTLDLATALGMDLQSAAQLVGKALEDPNKGMTQLARSGVVLSAQQKAVIKSLVDTGQTAKAQSTLLQELENRYGGAAEAARNTFGGAIAGLKNSFNDLLEGKGGMADATEAINALTDTLNSPEVKQGFETIVAGFAKVVEWAAKAAARIAGFAKATGQFFGELVANDKGAGLDDETRASRVANIEQMLDRLRKGWDGLSDSVQEARSRQIDRLESMLGELKKQQGLLSDVKPGAGAAPGGNPKPQTPSAAPYDPRKDAALADFRVTAQKDPLGLEAPMRKYYEDLQKLSQTSTEKQLADFANVESALNELYAHGDISAEKYTERFNEAFDELIPKVEVTAKKIGTTLLDQFDKVSQQMHELINGTTDILTGGLEDAAHGHFDNILKDFENLLIHMAAKAVAADIAGALFGKSAGGKGSGFVGAASDFLGGLFGGSRDSGGRGQPGMVYKIGTGAQPEYFAPDTPGTFHPRGAGMGDMGGAVVNQAIYVQGTVDERTQRQLALETARRQRQAQRLS